MAVLVVAVPSRERDLIVEALREARFAVDVAGTEHAALDRYRSHHALVIIDAQISGGRGVELCRALRQRSDVPVIVLTMSVDETDTIAALEAGADNCLPSGIRPRELVARARSAIRRTPPSGRQRVIEISGVRLDPASMQVTVRGASVALTRLEFALLELLMERAGRTVTRAELTHGLWGFDVERQTLATHVRRLRTKIEDDPSRPRRILTDRRAGYRYASPDTSG